MDHRELLARVQDVAATSDTLGRLLSQINAALAGSDGAEADADAGAMLAHPDTAPLLLRARQSLLDAADLLAASAKLVAASQAALDARVSSSSALVAAVRGQREADRARRDRDAAVLARSRALLERTRRGAAVSDGTTTPNLVVKPIRVTTGTADEEGRLVLADGRMVALLVLLSDPVHGDLVGSWHLEAGFDVCAFAVPPPPFDSIKTALAWIGHRLAAAATGLSRDERDRPHSA